MHTISLVLPRHLELEMDEVEGICGLLNDVRDGAWGLALCLDEEGRILGLLAFVNGVSDRVAQVAALASGCAVERIVLLYPAGAVHPWAAREIAALGETLGVEIQSEEFTRRDKSC